MLAGCCVQGMQMWYLTEKETVTGDNGGRQAVAGNLITAAGRSHPSDIRSARIRPRLRLSVHISLVSIHPSVQLEAKRVSLRQVWPSRRSLLVHLYIPDYPVGTLIPIRTSRRNADCIRF